MHLKHKCSIIISRFKNFIKIMKKALFLIVFVLIGCGEKSNHRIKHFPDSVDSIFAKSCAYTDCHLPDEHDLAGKRLHLPSELDLSSWTGAFKGSDHGAVIVPFSSSHSHVMEHIIGLRSPRMPPNYEPYLLDTLNQSVVDLIKTWIDQGAPSNDGDIAFEHSRKKVFTTNQVTDVITVLDQNSQLEMRVFEIGDRSNLSESPHGLEVTKDGKFFFTSMIVTGDIFKYSAMDGSFKAKGVLTDPVALIRLSADETKLYVTTNFQVNNTGTTGKISVLKTSDLTPASPAIEVGKSPHGIQLSRDGRHIYCTAVYSDRIYDIDTKTDALVDQFDVAGDVSPTSKYEPYHITTYVYNKTEIMFVTCRKSGEVRIFERSGNTFNLKDSVKVGKTPIQLDITPNGEKLFVANSADSSVSVIKRDVSGKFVIETTITKQTHGTETHRLSQPNGISVSADGKFVYVANRNKNGAIPPHHGGSGGPGLLTIIDTQTNEIIKTIELEPDAYSVKAWN